jgi:hypothetical protein
MYIFIFCQNISRKVHWYVCMYIGTKITDNTRSQTTMTQYRKNILHTCEDSTKFERLIPAASFSSLQVGEFVLNVPLAGCHKWRTHLPENWTCPISSKRKTSQFQSSTDVTENTSGALATYKLINYPHAYIWMLPTYIWTFVYPCTYVQTYIHTYECVFATLYGHHHELESYSELHTCICMYKWTFVYLCTHIWMSFCHNAKSTQYRNVVHMFTISIRTGIYICISTCKMW